MLYIYFPVLYYHDNLYVTEGAYAGGGVFRCPSGLSCLDIDHSVQMFDTELLKPCSDFTTAVCIT